MPDPVWFRSLYWRIALGFVAMLAVLLLLQAGLFLWLTGEFTASSSSNTPQQIADLVARDLSDALTDTPGLNLDEFVRERFQDVRQPFVVVMRDGQRASNRPGALPPGFGERPGRRGGPPGGPGGVAPPIGWDRPPGVNATDLPRTASAAAEGGEADPEARTWHPSSSTICRWGMSPCPPVRRRWKWCCGSSARP